ncbi:MAG: M56 family metallopeptidase [Bacillota bacterium]
MFNDYFISEVVHPFVLYVLFGTFFAFLLVKLAVRIFRLQESGAKVYLMFLPLLIPFLAYPVFRSLEAKKCYFRLDASHETLNIINNWLCSAGNFLATVLTPLFIIALVIAVSKSLISWYACRRIIRKYGFAVPGEYPDACALLDEVAGRAGIRPPKLVITGDRFARSFTFGFRRPVIVLSEGLLAHLDEDELETVMAHEVAHIVRADAVSNWITVVLRDLMFFTPVIFWVFRELIREKEQAADEITLRLTRKPMAFAQALIKVWRLSPRTFMDSLLLDNVMPNPHFVSGAGVLENRVQRIIDDNGLNFSDRKKVLVILTAITAVTLGILYLVC